ncbi:hypothetical protein D3H65_25970 [Paraflavitalea soli]|uniref:Peptidase S9 prolyl oligopeptidase catalytic domain-containing protein n=1 Tax=Paraflavitalea soli TaxID=2315862 RepID=A0A3B7MVZ7_9BACT|nr:prolyl oligopeptidase family serine peptidase [Paraflavitalea soli]AXY77220.1 hypothetical protein D3H65_25970 [Paraflavitalea soli]
MKANHGIALFFLLGSLISCKKKDILAGYDKAALFASATTTEINAVTDMWAKRNLVPQEITVEETHVITAKLSLHIISFRLLGSKEYAGVLVPVTDHPVPVQFYVGGYSTKEDPVNSSAVEMAGEDLPFVYVVPAMRGQYVSLRVKGKEYRSSMSEGSRFDAFDGATDDVIATLNAVGALFSQADTARAMIRGGSRGGIVALLAGERDQRFKRVAAVAFNADFIGLTAQLYNDPTYREQFMSGLINGTTTIAGVRQLMIASSPLYFCSRLPKTQLHCAQNDRITPAAQGELLFNTMKTLGLQHQVELFIYPNRDHDNIATGNTEMAITINTFFSTL